MNNNDEKELLNQEANDTEVIATPDKLRLDFDFTESEEDETDDDGVVDLKKTYSDKMFLRLKMAMDRVKKYYSDFRNELNKYDKIIFRSTNTGDTYSYKNKVILKVSVFSRALKIYFALNPKDFEDKYHIVNMKEIKKYENIPLMIRVSSDRSYKYLMEIFASFIKKYRLPKKAKANMRNYDRDVLSNSQEILQLLGYADKLMKSCTIKSCEELPNSVAKNCQIIQTNPFKTKDKKEIYEVTIGELSAAFKSKYEIDLFLLKEVGMAPMEANYLRVIAKGDCKCKLSVVANDYDVTALKMIVITGGNVIKYVN